MTATRIVALSTILALGLWVGPAAAGDADAGAPAADDLLMANGDQLDPGQMSAAAGGHAVEETNIAIAVADNDNTFTITHGGELNTGAITSTNTNTGGITVSLMNTGAGVVMQNATNINIYLSSHAGNAP